MKYFALTKSLVVEKRNKNLNYHPRSVFHIHGI